MTHFTKLFFFIFLLFCGTSCKEEIKLTLTDDQMIDVLTDMHIAEAAILSLNKKLKDSVATVYYAQIFEIHGVEDSVFNRDIEILRNDAKHLEDIYQKVIVKIEQLDIGSPEVPKLEKDSLGNLNNRPKIEK